MCGGLRETNAGSGFAGSVSAVSLCVKRVAKTAAKGVIGRTGYAIIYSL